jgi:hypothetical protein
MLGQKKGITPFGEETMASRSLNHSEPYLGTRSEAGEIYLADHSPDSDMLSFSGFNPSFEG